jgi:hypothetical protein
MKSDQALFDDRPARARTCGHCRGHGTVVESYALVSCEPFDGAPHNAVHAAVVGSFDIFTACKEAVALAKRARRPVAFNFIDQVVVLNPGDDPDKAARAWWQHAYNETPETTMARR